MRIAILLLIVLLSSCVSAELSHQIADVYSPSYVSNGQPIYISFVLRNISGEINPSHGNDSKTPITVSFNKSIIGVSGITVDFLDAYNRTENSVVVNNSLVMFKKAPDTPPNRTQVQEMITAGYQDSYRYDYDINSSMFTLGNIDYVYGKIMNYTDYIRYYGIRISGNLPSGNLGVIIEADVQNDTDRRFNHSKHARVVEVGGSGSSASSLPSTTNARRDGVFLPFFRGTRWNATVVSTDPILGPYVLSTILYNRSTTIQNEYLPFLQSNANLGATAQIIVGACNANTEILLHTNCRELKDNGYIDLYSLGTDPILIVAANSSRMLIKTIGALFNLTSIDQLPIIIDDSGTFHATLPLNGTDSDSDGVIDSQDPDDDNDHVTDWDDPVIGNGSVGFTNASLELYISGLTQRGQVRDGLRPTKIMKGVKPIIEFAYDYDDNQLNLSGVTIVSVDSLSGSYIVVKGLEVGTKTAYLGRANLSFTYICIKDAVVNDISAMTSGCTAADERIISCDGTPVNGYRCTLNESLNMYKVEGLGHSAVRQFYAPTAVAAPSTPPASCTTNWKCTNWSACGTDGTRSRSCVDIAYCYKPTSTMPSVSEDCAVKKTESAKPAPAKSTVTDPDKDLPINLSGLPSEIKEEKEEPIKTVTESSGWTKRDYYIFGGALLFMAISWMIMYMLFS